MEEVFLPIIITLGVCVVLPVMMVWLVFRHKTNETNKRSEIILAAIEKNSEIDVEEFFKKMTPSHKTYKEKLQKWLLGGAILTGAGLGLLGLGLFLDVRGESSLDNLTGLYMFGLTSFLIGVAIIIVYVICRKDSAKERESGADAEEKE